MTQIMFRQLYVWSNLLFHLAGFAASVCNYGSMSGSSLPKQLEQSLSSNNYSCKVEGQMYTTVEHPALHQQHGAMSNLG